MTIKITVPAAAMREPFDSEEVTIDSEEAAFCDGSECGAAVFDENGELELLRPHWHMIVRGKLPEAGPRLYPIWAE